MHLLKWLYPGMRFKRWLCLFAVGALLTGLGLAIVFNYKYIDSIEEFLFYAVYTWTGSYDYMITAIVGIAIIVFGLIIQPTNTQVRSATIGIMTELEMKSAKSSSEEPSPNGWMNESTL